MGIETMTLILNSGPHLKKLANRHKKRNQVGNKVKWPGYGLTLCIRHCIRTMHYKCPLHYVP